MASTLESVKEYYGKLLSKTEDLKTNACCTAKAPPVHVQNALAKIHADVLAKYYGCGLCLPDAIEGCTILDLGCGSGRDVYIASQFVGPNGKVIGVDMTEAQLEVARRTQPYHAERFGFGNVEFKLGYIEKLGDLGIAPGSVDIIISNCVLNLSPDKEAVLRGCYELLKPGGEVFFSDVYASRKVPKSLRENEILWGECISGALYWNDFMSIAKQSGFLDPRLVEDKPVTIDNPELEELCSPIKFFSGTYRLWKLPALESDCEDYGQAVIYKGTIPRCAATFTFDGHHVIETGKVFGVCGNTYRMLHDTRLAPHFDFIGSFDTHYGIYAGCGKTIPFASAYADTADTPCC